jgi:aminoglycoside phosphotransferase (APT) family kinase protein
MEGGDMKPRGNPALQVAAELGVVATLRALRARRFTQRHAADLTRCVPGGMVLDGIERSVTDVVVGRAHADDGSQRVIVKLARSSRGATSLRRASNGLAALRADARLDGWEVTRPEILDIGELDGLPYVVESALSGVTAARLLRQGAPWQPLAALAIETIEGLHRRSGAPVRVDSKLLGRWIDGPVEAIRPLVAGSRRREAAMRALDRELTTRLDGATATAGWIHGDYVPDNVLFDPKADRITGIIDWEMAETPDLPAIDRAMFLLAAHSQTQRREIGALVAAVAKGEASEALRRSLATAAHDGLEDLLDVRALALLCWLRHVAAVVTQSERYARHRMWKRYNVYQVLDALARR